jgi:methionyl-tRNA formyltransferase
MDRLRIIICAYREWALKIAYSLPYDVKVVFNPEALGNMCDWFEPHIILLLGWSWIVPKEIYDKYCTICLHPSPLPKYRGGSPIQHQILCGEKESKVTLFKVNDFLDGGPIFIQERFSLEGNMKDILERISRVGKQLLMEILPQYPNFVSIPQVGEPTIFKRRKPRESELTFDDFKNMNAKDIYNFIRALGDPYPNAFIVCGDGKKLYFKEVSL